jgi:cystathionine beta-lyase family protein involved in aluminum resistance
LEIKMYCGFDFCDETVSLSARAEKDCEKRFAEIDENCMLWSGRILDAFQKCNVSTSDFLEITGYGYDDPGRDKIEKIYSRIFGTQDALVRPQMMSGTHALALTLGGLLKYGDTMLSISGAPYDTLRSVIGTEGGSRNSLMANGVKYEQIDLIDNDFDLPAVRRRIARGGVKLVEIQRSRGYARRKSLTMDKIARAIEAVKSTDPEVIVMVDNCYGEFTEEREPTHAGADIMVGSMMKNPGGGLAVTGAYCAGRAELINDVAERLTAPMVGKSLGANMNQLTSFYKGLFLAPSVTRAALKSMVFAARLLELAGFSGIDPAYDEKRTDIVQTVDLSSAENLINFCVGLQHGSPVEAFATPEPGEMPGYPNDEIMACGTFTTGATIELSADGPLCPPYTAFMQGGLTYEYGKLGVMTAVDNMIRKN